MNAVAPTPPDVALPAPQSAPDPLPYSYPLHALGKVLGTAAQAVHNVVQAPVPLCGHSFLAAASYAAQSVAVVAIDGRREPLSLWHLTVAGSGERKGSVDRWALRAHEDLERTGESLRAGMAQWDADPAAWPFLLAPNATREGVHHALHEGSPSVGLFDGEADDLLDDTARAGGVTSPRQLARLWDRGEFIGGEAGEVYPRRLALHLRLSPAKAEAMLAAETFNDSGFLARALIAWPDSTIGTRKYCATDLTTDPAMVRYWSRMADLLPMTPVAPSGTALQLMPRALTLTPDAKAHWIAGHNVFEKAMVDVFVPIRAWATKAPAQMLRIAGVLALADDPHATEIDHATMWRAGQLVAYYMTTALRLAGVIQAVPYMPPAGGSDGR